MSKPLLAVPMGDPCGIGPEILAKALATGEPQTAARLLLIGSRKALQDGIALAGAALDIHAVRRAQDVVDAPGVVSLLDDGALDPAEIVYGQERAACGRAVGGWIAVAQQLAQAGTAHGLVLGPVNSEAMAAGGTLGQLMQTEDGKRCLALFSGPLRIVHIFDHVHLEEVCRRVSAELVTGALRITQDTLAGWGVQRPRIGVAGLNPHAHGPQEDRAIIPGVAAARAQGINAIGPIAPDTVFRHCIEGRYDVVLAMCHDQGHIALKTWGFEGNCGGFIGMPYLFMTVGHGTAFDIAGQGIASPAMMLMALQQCANFAAGRGFL